MTKPPERIWLQWHGDGDPDPEGVVHDEDVTWCRERIFDNDIEYVRRDLAEGESA